METTGKPTGTKWINLTDYTGGVAYVIYAARGDDKIPIYVGESEKVIARLGDYVRAQFGAPTDFKVGRTARLLEERGYEILVEIEKTPDRRARERELIEKHGDRPLLNSIASYDYKTANEDEYLSVLEEYVRENFSDSRSVDTCGD